MKQGKSKATASSAQRRSVGMALKVLLIGTICVGLGLIAVTAASYAMYAQHANPRAAGGEAQVPGLAGTAGTVSVSPSDLQKMVQATVDANLKSEELLLDKLLLMVGIYTTILSFLAAGTVIVNRQDAKEQLARIDLLAKSTGEKLVQLQTHAEEDIEELKTQIKTEFPFISQTQNRILGLIQKLEAKYPEDEDLNRPLDDSWAREERQQDVLMDELQIVAVSVIVLDVSSLLKLYMVLSRSYFDRFRTGKRADGDAARAILYASRAIDCSNQYAEAYRMRGVSGLVRYQSAEPERQRTAEFRELRLKAKADLLQCAALDSYNAGAIYNLALIYDDEGDTGKAISLSEGLIAPESEKYVLRQGQEKYFADVYINLACYFARQAGETDETREQTRLWEKAITTCQAAQGYLRDRLKSSRATGIFTASLERELGPEGDFVSMPEDRRKIVEGLLEEV